MRLGRERAPSHMKALAERAGEKIRYQQLFALDDSFGSRFSMSHRGHQVTCYANQRSIWYQVRAVSGVVLAIGRPVPEMLVTQPMALTVGPHERPVYVRADSAEAAVQGWLTSPHVAEAVTALDLRRRDRLYLSGGSLSVVISPRSDEENWALLDRVVELAELVPAPAREEAVVQTVDGLELDPERLPDEFRHLVPLIRKWSIGDDVERAEKEEGASREELQELYDTVAPLFEAIDAYLNELEASSEPYPSEGHLLSYLAEAAAEVQVGLQRRRR